MTPRQIPPEHPFPEYAPLSRGARFWIWVRDHGFSLTLGLLLLTGFGVYRAVDPFDRPTFEAVALQGPAEVETMPRPAASPYDSLALLSVQTYPDGAEVYLEGTSLGLAPIQRVRVAPGTYRVSFELPAHAPRDSVVTLTGGDTTRLVVALLKASIEDRWGVLDVARDNPSRGGSRGNQRRRAAPASPPETGTARPPTTPERVGVAEIQSLLTGRLELRSEPEATSVWLDQQFVGYTPLSIKDVSPGDHLLSFRKLGYESSTTLVAVEAGATISLNPRLNPLAGTLRVLVKPWGSIYIDGALKQEASNVRYSSTLPPGQYRVTVIHPVLGRWETTAEIEAGKETSFVVDLNQRSNDPPAPEAPRGLR